MNMSQKRQAELMIGDTKKETELKEKFLDLEEEGLATACLSADEDEEVCTTPRRTSQVTDNQDNEVLLTPREPVNESNRRRDLKVCQNIAAAYGVRPTQNDKSMVRHYPYYTMRHERIHSPGSLLGKYTRSPRTPLSMSPSQSPRESPLNVENRGRSKSLLASAIISSKSANSVNVSFDLKSSQFEQVGSSSVQWESSNEKDEAILASAKSDVSLVNPSKDRKDTVTFLI